MKPSFCLISEPWIPCLKPAGEVQELGLQETLCRAHEISEVSDPSPPVTASLYRLLLAVLHRVFGPRNSGEWKRLWEAGEFGRGQLDEYFSQWRHRFDLFDEERPFYQVAGMDDKLLKSVANLAPQCSSGNNAALFDHTLDETQVEVESSIAARLLLVQQGFALGGLCGTETGRVAAQAAPLVAGAVILAMGKTLFETLMLNLVVYDCESDKPLPCRDDAPAWEQDNATSPEVRRPDGYLDYLTWQSRRLWLRPQPTAAGGWHVSQVIVTNAREFPKDYFLHEDPMLAYGRREKAPPGQDPWPALRFRENRALWRDSLALLQSIPDQRQRPAILDHLGERIEEGVLGQEARLDLAAIGLCSNQAKMFFWRHERQPLPVRYLSNPELVEHLRGCLEATEQVEADLRAAVWRLAEEVLAPGDRTADKEAVRTAMAGLGTVGAYWSMLEPRFHRLVADLAERPAEADDISKQWLSDVCQEARRQLDNTARGLQHSGRMLRATTSAQRLLNSRLHKFATPTEEVSHAAAE